MARTAKHPVDPASNDSYKILGNVSKTGSHMKQNPSTAAFAGTAFCIAALLAGIVLYLAGTEMNGVCQALRISARFAFILFWFAYAGGALRTLFGHPFEAVAWRQPDFILAFAAAQLVHCGLVVWLYRTSGQAPLPRLTLLFFAAGLFWTYLLALISNRRLARAIGQVRWRMLRLAGMEYISLVFLFEFVSLPMHDTVVSLVFYLPFAILSLLGTFLRMGAWASRGATTTKSA
jgi:hypothetical protein